MKSWTVTAVLYDDARLSALVCYEQVGGSGEPAELVLPLECALEKIRNGESFEAIFDESTHPLSLEIVQCSDGSTTLEVVNSGSRASRRSIHQLPALALSADAALPDEINGLGFAGLSEREIDEMVLEVQQLVRHVDVHEIRIALAASYPKEASTVAQDILRAKPHLLKIH